MNNTQRHDLLSEILMAPSSEIIAERFSPEKNESDSADCTGKCASGVCKGLV